MTAPERPRLLVFNQYYRPGPEATGQLLADLCDALAADFDVTVITGALLGEAPPGRERRGDVEVVRVRSTSFERSRLGRRAFNYVSYLTGALASGLRQPPPDVVLSMTDPPFVGDVALIAARRYRAPLVVVSQDVFPEAALAVGRLDNPLVAGLLRVLVGAYLRRADCVVAIGETMRRRLVAKGARRERVAVIPNWVDAAELAPQPHDNEWSRAKGLAGKFVVMHSGNVGHAQDLDTLVEAAARLAGEKNTAFAIVGNGARRRDLERRARDVGAGIFFLDYQPRKMLPLSLSAAHVHVVGLAAGLSGYVVPSRLYGVLAVGRPAIVAADEESETARLVREAGCGIVIPPGRPDLLARTIRDARDGVHDLEAMGLRGRAWVEAEADRSIAVARYRDLLHDVLGG